MLLIIRKKCVIFRFRYSFVKEQIGDHGNKLQTILTQSQGVQEGLTSMLRWLDETDGDVSLDRPLPLNKDKLTDLLKQQRVTQADIERNKPAIAALIAEGENLLAKDPSNHKLRQHLDDLKRRYDQLSDRNADWGEKLTSTNERLEKVNEEMVRLGLNLEPTLDGLSSGELLKQDLNSFAPEVRKYSEDLNLNKADLERLRDLYESLVESGNVVESAAIREKLRSLESKFEDAEKLVEERTQQVQQRSVHFAEYDEQKSKVDSFLKLMEDEVDRFAPVGLNLNVLNRQSDDLVPYTEKHQRFRPEIDSVEQLGYEYHRMVNGDTQPDGKSNGHFLIAMFLDFNFERFSTFTGSKSPAGSFLASPGSTTSSGFSSYDNMSALAGEKRKLHFSCFSVSIYDSFFFLFRFITDSTRSCRNETSVRSYRATIKRSQ